MLAITFDIDWAADEIIQYTVNFLQDHGVKATLFATHKSDYLQSLDNNLYEIALHPNFNQDTNYFKIIKDLKNIYPDAIGIRSHSLFQSSDILKFIICNDLKYEVNTFVPQTSGLHPFIRMKGLVSLPFCWEDDYHFLMGFPWHFSCMHIDIIGLKIYNFHPMHVFMNTNSIEHYNRFKMFYQEPSNLRKYRNKGSGVQTIFIELLKHIAKNNLPTYTCAEIYSRYLNEQLSHTKSNKKLKQPWIA